MICLKPSKLYFGAVPTFQKLLNSLFKCIIFYVGFPSRELTIQMTAVAKRESFLFLYQFYPLTNTQEFIYSFVPFLSNGTIYNYQTVTVEIYALLGIRFSLGINFIFLTEFLSDVTSFSKTSGEFGFASTITLLWQAIKLP